MIVAFWMNSSRAPRFRSGCSRWASRPGLGPANHQVVVSMDVRQGARRHHVVVRHLHAVALAHDVVGPLPGRHASTSALRPIAASWPRRRPAAVQN